jgi:hypothetical protein
MKCVSVQAMKVHRGVVVELCDFNPLYLISWVACFTRLPLYTRGKSLWYSFNGSLLGLGALVNVLENVKMSRRCLESNHDLLDSRPTVYPIYRINHPDFQLVIGLVVYVTM